MQENGGLSISKNQLGRLNYLLVASSQYLNDEVDLSSIIQYGAKVNDILRSVEGCHEEMSWFYQTLEDALLPRLHYIASNPHSRVVPVSDLAAAVDVFSHSAKVKFLGNGSFYML